MRFIFLILGHAPKTLTSEEAAALPLTSITAYEGLFTRLGISKNAADNQTKSILIIGGAGGVGSIAIQLAKWAGLHVIASASRQETIDWCKTLGADHTVNHRHNLAEEVQALGLSHVDYIFCLNNTAGHFDNMVELIKPQGKICTIVETDKPLDITKLQGKSATFVWELMFTRSMFNTDDIQEQHALLDHVADLVDNGVIKHTLTKSITPINAENMRKAHALLEQGDMIGKLVVSKWN